MKKYYTLLTKERGVWSPQFGSYVYGDCLSERDDYLDHGRKLKDMKIITTADDQASVNARIQELNL